MEVVKLLFFFLHLFHCLCSFDYLPEMDSEPAGTVLDDLFRKTKTLPAIYWLPLTDEQVGMVLCLQAGLDDLHWWNTFMA